MARTLAIDTATPACSVALFEDGELIAGACEEIGRGHAERLVPMIRNLPQAGIAEHIVVNRGPGSFTGIRIGLSVARALGLAWRAAVTAYETHQIVAHRAQLVSGAEDAHICVAMLGGHGQIFVQNFASDLQPLDDVRAVYPEELLLSDKTTIVAGSAIEQISQNAKQLKTARLLPDARDLFLMTEHARALEPVPKYVRDADAVPAKI